MVPALEFRHIEDGMHHALAEFFVDLSEGADEEFFHPHPLTREHAATIASYAGMDLYYALTVGKLVIAYGMLRGWDEGFDTPSLGIAVAKRWRGIGIGRAMITMLHVAARFNGASRIRLKVHKRNTSAIELYKALGYKFQDTDGEQLIGFLTL
ncbi:GNAT family N-acetyltransferase [Occallatibacter savannae]|uniref:GNAT family N-acetyltransferase n=1 Tax=Occallatibacter savannae TaxID=1002691 RepID=UPI0013A56805|nr:GNAT family N-acetyltransferase [Occallatibacter savannae]